MGNNTAKSGKSSGANQRSPTRSDLVWRALAENDRRLHAGPITRARVRRWARRKGWLRLRAPANFGICGCMGPQDNAPLCPCRMRDTVLIDGTLHNAISILGFVLISKVS